jgi:Ras-related protein Rab-11A
MEEKDKQKDNILKVVLLGETATGKSNLINVFLGNKFNPISIPTLNPDSSEKKINIYETNYIINIWDTIGQEKYRAMTKLFLKGANIVIFVYDITKKSSFIELNYWVKIVEEELGDDPILGVCANKIDLFSMEEVNAKEGQEFANKINALFVETSAKEDPISFNNFIIKLLKQYHRSKNNIKNDEETIVLERKPSKRKKFQLFC